MNNSLGLRLLTSIAVVSLLLATVREVHAQTSDESVSIPVLLEHIEAPDDGLRKEAVATLCAMGADAAPALVDALQAPSAFLRSQAREALLTIGDPAMPALLEAMKSDTFQPGYVLKAMKESGQGVLIAAAHDPSPLVRRNALAAGVPTGILIESLDDEVPAVQAVAAWALTHRRGEEIAVALERELAATQDPALKRLIARALFYAQLQAEPAQDLPRYTLIASLISHDEHRLEYSLQFQDTSDTFDLAPLICPVEDGIVSRTTCQGFDEETLSMQWADQGRLLQVNWDTVPQGNGKYEATSTLLFEREPRNWRILWRDTGEGPIGGLGSGGFSGYDYTFNYNPETQDLKFSKAEGKWFVSTKPEPLTKPANSFQQDVDSDVESYEWNHKAEFTQTQEWPCEVVEGKVTCGEGIAILDVGEQEFPFDELVRFLAGDDASQAERDTTAAKLSELNPQLRLGNVWTGQVLTSIAERSYVPDESIHLHHPATP